MRENITLSQLAGDDYYQYKAGKKTSVELLPVLVEMNWKIVTSCYRAMSMFKAKPWRDSGKLPSTADYQEAVMECWLILIGMLDFIGWDEYAMWANYYVKNQKNLERLKNKY